MNNDDLFLEIEATFSKSAPNGGLQAVEKFVSEEFVRKSDILRVATELKKHKGLSPGEYDKTCPSCMYDIALEDLKRELGI